jgi:hypothetical protein
MSRKVLILKESELIELIKSTFTDIQEQSYSKDKWLSGDNNPSSPNYQIQTNFDKKQAKALKKGLKDFGDWFYRAFIDCDETIDCIQNALDGIAIVSAFIPGPGWIVSGIAGLASAGISIHNEDYAMGGAMIAFELFPITRVGKRVYNGVKAAKTADVDKVMVKMLDSGFDVKTYKSLKGKEKEIAEYLLRNVDEVADDVMKAVKNLKNNKMSKDLMKLTNTELKLVAKQSGTNYQNLKVTVEMMRSQAKNIDDYAAFFNNWRTVAKEMLIMGTMVTTSIATYLGTEWVMNTFYGGSRSLKERVNKQAKELAEEHGVNVGEGYANEMAPCRIFAELLLLAEGNCNFNFSKFLRESLWDSEGMSGLEMIREYLGMFNEGDDRNKEIKRIFEEYAGYGTACLSKKWKGGKAEQTVYLDYYAKSLDCGIDCCGTNG